MFACNWLYQIWDYIGMVNVCWCDSNPTTFAIKQLGSDNRVEGIAYVLYVISNVHIIYMWYIYIYILYIDGMPRVWVVYFGQVVWKSCALFPPVASTSDSVVDHKRLKASYDARGFSSILPAVNHCVFVSFQMIMDFCVLWSMGLRGRILLPLEPYLYIYSSILFVRWLVI